MNKIYFSNETIRDMSKWDDSRGVLKVFVYPKNIFSIVGWKMSFMFMKDFACYFLTGNKEDNRKAER